MRGIARLAQELGVSTATISRALNGNPNVNKDTRKMVLEAAQRLGYVANQAARSLAQGVTRSVGFTIEIDLQSSASTDYFFMGVIEGVQSVLAEYELDLLVLPCAKSQDHYTYLERFISRSAVDGMILAETRQIDRRIELLQGSGVPFVTLGRSDTGSGYSWIDLDFEGVMKIAVDRLLARGHRRIALTVPRGNANYGPIFERAFRERLAHHGLAADPDLIMATGRCEDDGDVVVDHLLSLAEPATAVILFYEVTAIGVYRRLRQRGLQPGRDMAVIGFRDEQSVRFLTPSVTCFHLSLHELGIAAARALVEQMPSTQRGQERELVQCCVPLDLVEGDSDNCEPASA